MNRRSKGMSVLNRTRGTLLAKIILTLNTNFPNVLRHLNRNGLPDNCALWISPCRAIYTIGMRNPVDIAFLDKNAVVIKIFRGFPPGCFTNLVNGSTSAVELPRNRLSESDTHIGDILQFDPV